jgi:arabinogalactan endo-1,4-beta-galactosidase
MYWKNREILPFFAFSLLSIPTFLSILLNILLLSAAEVPLVMLLQTALVFAFAPFIVNAGLAYKGVDWSSTLTLEKSGKSFKTTDGKTATFETILKASGVNTVRQRLWINPSDGVYNLAYNIELGKRAKAAGLGVYLDLHFSDTWADPAHQVLEQSISRVIFHADDSILDTAQGLAIKH